MSVVQEFKGFVMRGNVVDLAVGVIIGGAFGKISGSLVGDIMMPPIGLLLSGVDFKSAKFILKAADEATKTAEVAITYGSFIQALIEFLITAFVIFLVVKMFNSFKKEEEAAPPVPTPPPAEEVLLTEIRDLLKKQAAK